MDPIHYPGLRPDLAGQLARLIPGTPRIVVHPDLLWDIAAEHCRDAVWSSVAAVTTSPA